MTRNPGGNAMTTHSPTNPKTSLHALVEQLTNEAQSVEQGLRAEVRRAQRACDAILYSLDHGYDVQPGEAPRTDRLVEALTQRVATAHALAAARWAYVRTLDAGELRAVLVARLAATSFDIGADYAEAIMRLPDYEQGMLDVLIVLTWRDGEAIMRDIEADLAAANA